MLEPNKSNYYDVIIVGGGAAGILSAISTKKNFPKYTVLIVDRTFALGRKILVSGSGRCNITNSNLASSYQNKYNCQDKKFISSVFSQFGYKDIVDFFENLGIKLYEESKNSLGKVFPKTDQAKTITSLLEEELISLNIDILLNTQVNNVTKKGTEFQITCQEIGTKQKSRLESKYLIIAAGGKTYPALGSDGSGFSIAQSLGHKIVQPVPAAVPLISKNQLLHLLQGVKLEAGLTLQINNIEIISTVGDVIFTQYGLSGSGILEISREISVILNRGQKAIIQVFINFMPGKSAEAIAKELRERWAKYPLRTLNVSLYGIFQNKVADAFAKLLGYENTLVCDLKKEDLDFISKKLAAWEFDITGTRGWNEAEFTAGGVDIGDIKINTLESKIVDSLYFCGEVIDVDGSIGGYNLSWAWSSGWVAGMLK